MWRGPSPGLHTNLFTTPLPLGESGLVRGELRPVT
jgi:hypothetical protein